MQSDSRDQDEKTAIDDAEAPSCDEESAESDFAETAVLPEAEPTDNVGDVSVEINVEELVAKLEAEQSDDAARKKGIRQRLEEIVEDKDFESTYAIEFDNEDNEDNE